MQPDLIGGRYRVESAIGQGGMGTVWLCRDETLHRSVAVKQVGLLPGESVTDSARALREARSTAALSHRNVVTVFDVVEEAGAIWLVMEHVPGRSLSEIIREDGPLPPATVADIGAQVADGLAAAHAAGTMHRDVKPGNVLVRDDGLAKISDFGIARSAGDPALTQSGFLTGTPSYFSPELARGADPGAGTDVWALGATLYAAVEGRPPYEAKANPVAVLHDITSTQPPRPRRAEFLEPALLRMLDRDPESRWSMADAAHGLRRLADANSPERTRENTRKDPATARFAAPAAPATAAAATGATAAAAAAARASDRGEEPGPSRASTPPGPAAPKQSPGRPRSRRRGPVYALLVLVALLLVLGGVAFAASLRDDGGSAGNDTPGGTSPSQSPSQQASDTPSRSPSQSSQGPSRSSTPTGSGTGLAAKKAFLSNYFSKAPGGTDAGWALLTPRYQQEIGRGSYDGFWSTIRSVDVGEVRTAGGNTVDASLTYTRTDGSTTTEQHQLTLVPSGGGYLIDGDN
jgi:eukaryotic-like serine/threonine-protein kinase